MNRIVLEPCTDTLQSLLCVICEKSLIRYRICYDLSCDITKLCHYTCFNKETCGNIDNMEM